MRRIEEIYYEAKSDKWFIRFAVFCRIALAAIFILTGIVKIRGQRFAEGLLLLVRARLLHARGEPVDAVRAAAEAARARSDERGAYLFARRSERFLAEIDQESPDI